MTRLTQIDTELAERLRQFEVVCKVARQTRHGKGRYKGFTLKEIGWREFGLTEEQVKHCRIEAQKMLDRFRGVTSDYFFSLKIAA